jgi:glycerol-3-phosphate dehydrogenase
MIPYEQRYTLVGTTDVPQEGDALRPEASPAEVEYLCRAASRYLERVVNAGDVVWQYAGVRPLYDDGSPNPSAVTRDYVLRLDSDQGGTPVLSIFGGKITTYRRLAEHALERLAPWFPDMGPAWTAAAALPGGDLRGESFSRFSDVRLQSDFPWLPATARQGLARRHGALAYEVLGDATSLEAMGKHFGGDLYAREVDYLLAREWAHDADDILWRRTKAGLHLAPPQRAAVAEYVADMLGKSGKPMFVR